MSSGSLMASCPVGSVRKKSNQSPLRERREQARDPVARRADPHDDEHEDEHGRRRGEAVARSGEPPGDDEREDDGDRRAAHPGDRF